MPKLPDNNAKRVPLNCLVRPDTKQEIQERAVNGKSQGDVIDEAVSALYRETGTAYDPHGKKKTKREQAIADRRSGDVVAQRAQRDDIDYSDVESTQTTNVVTLDATGPPLSGGKGKATMDNWRSNRKPLLKPKERKSERSKDG